MGNRARDTRQLFSAVPVMMASPGPHAPGFGGLHGAFDRREPDVDFTLELARGHAARSALTAFE